MFAKALQFSVWGIREKLLFRSLCRPGRREEDVEESTIFRDFEIVSQEAAKWWEDLKTWKNPQKTSKNFEKKNIKKTIKNTLKKKT